MSKLEVSAFKDGGIVRQSTKNPEWGSVMVKSSTLTLSNGIADTKTRYGFVRAKLDFLNSLGLSEGMDLNAKLQSLGANACKIRVIETLEPRFEGHQPKINPQSEEIITNDAGNPIYRDTEVVEIHSGLNDEFIPSGVAVAETAEAQEAGDVA